MIALICFEDRSTRGSGDASARPSVSGATPPDLRPLLGLTVLRRGPTARRRPERPRRPRSSCRIPPFTPARARISISAGGRSGKDGYPLRAFDNALGGHQNEPVIHEG